MEPIVKLALEVLLQRNFLTIEMLRQLKECNKLTQKEYRTLYERLADYNSNAKAESGQSLSSNECGS